MPERYDHGAVVQCPAVGGTQPRERGQDLSAYLHLKCIVLGERLAEESLAARDGGTAAVKDGEREARSRPLHPFSVDVSFSVKAECPVLEQAK